MKKFQLRNAILLAAVLFTSSLLAQDWVKMMNDPNTNFYDVQKAFNTYYAKKETQIEREKRKLARKTGVAVPEGEMEVPGYEQYKRWEYFMQTRVSPTGERFDPAMVWKEMTKYREQYGTFSAGSWTLKGPISPTVPSGGGGAGRLNFITVHPTNPSTMWVGSPGGGLWKSINGGTSWTTNTDQLAQVIGCTDLAIDPTTPNTMYLGTGDGDGGDTYSVGLLKSTDGGTTWNTTGLSFSMGQYIQVSKIIIDPTNTNTIFVATSSGVYKSTNAGVSFTVALTGSFKDIEFKPGTSSTVYACGNQFYYSTNGGTSWTLVSAVLPAAAACQRMAIAVSAANPAVVYAVTAKVTTYDLEGFYKSINSGVSFTKLTVSAAIIGTQGFYALSLAASPTNANEVFAGGLDIYKCTNAPNSGTATFSAMSSWVGSGGGYVHADIHELEYDGTNIYAACDGGVFTSTSGGASWSDLSNGLQISEMYGFGQSTTNANLLVQGWQDNGTNLYNGSWQRVIGGDGMKAFVSWGNDQNMWGSLYNGQLQRSTNGGLSFAACTSGITDPLNTWVTEWNEDPITANTIYAGFANVWKSTNGGTSWTKPGTVGTGTVNIQAIAVSPANNQVIWAAKGADLYKSVNGGGAWTIVTGGLPPGNITDIVCSPTDAQKAWVTYGGFTNTSKVFQTTNQGTSWTNYCSPTLPNIPVNCITIDKNGNDALYIGTDVGVFFKDASMTVWQPFSSGLPNVVVSELEMFYSGNKIRTSTYGRGVWESGLYVPGAYAPTANFGADRKIACPGAAVQFTDYSAGQPTSWSWTFTGGNPATSTQQNPLVSYNVSGTYPVSLTATNANGTDTKTFTSYITISNAAAAPFTTGKSFCNSASVILNATPQSAGTVRWWNAPGGGNVVGTGNSYTTPVLSATTTYYVDETFPPGMSDVAGLGTRTGTGAMFSANDIRGLYFDVLQPVTLNSFDIYANSAGNRTIQILDSQGNDFYDTTVFIPASPTTPATVPVKIIVYPGTSYFIKFLGLVDCWRDNAGANGYPYTSTAVNITNSNAGSPGYYYFFYNWQYNLNSCNTARTPCTALDSCATGIVDPIAGGAMNIFPNPNNGNFMLSFQTQNKDNYKIRITNTLGQTVYEENLDGFSGDYSKKMDVATYGKGVYMLSISNSKNETVKKVMVY